MRMLYLLRWLVYNASVAVGWFCWLYWFITLFGFQIKVAIVSTNRGFSLSPRAFFTIWAFSLTGQSNQQYNPFLSASMSSWYPSIAIYLDMLAYQGRQQSATWRMLESESVPGESCRQRWQPSQVQRTAWTSYLQMLRTGRSKQR